MSRTHPALQRFNHKLGGMSTRNLEATVDRVAIDADVQARAERAKAEDVALMTRIYHPAVKAPEHKCYRVIRRWKGEAFGEDIGFRRTETEAVLLMNRELGWAIVIDPNGRRKAHNFQAMTERP